MTERIIHCRKLDKKASGLTEAPLPGAIGQRLYEEISQTAWQAWLSHQTMLINEYQLPLSDPKTREFLQNEMEKFLFGAGSSKPAGYTPPHE